MIASMAAMVVAHAETAPSLNTTLSYNEETGEGTITVGLKGINDLNFARMLTSFAVNVHLDGSFDETYYETSAIPVIPGNIDKNIVAVGGLEGQTIIRNNRLDDLGFVRVGYGPTTTSPVTGDADLFSFAFKVTDTSKENKIIVKDAEFNFNTWTEAAQQINYGFAQEGVAGDWDGVMTASGDSADGSYTFGGGDVEIVIPPATGATATGGQLLDLKPSDIGLEGDEWTTEDPAYADEKAVVSLANVKKDDAITGFTWEIKATDAEGNPLEKTTEYFKAGNIESAAEVTVGLVVGYDTTEWQSVEIVGVTAE